MFDWFKKKVSASSDTSKQIKVAATPPRKKQRLIEVLNKKIRLISVHLRI